MSPKNDLLDLPETAERNLSLLLLFLCVNPNSIERLRQETQNGVERNE